MGLTKIATLAKPAGFFNPENPADLRPPVPPKKGEEAAKDAEPAPAAAAAPAAATPPAREEEEDLTEFAERTPLLDFANTDMAFFGDVMVASSAPAVRATYRSRATSSS